MGGADGAGFVVRALEERRGDISKLHDERLKEHDRRRFRKGDR